MADTVYPGNATPAQVLAGQIFSASTSYNAVGTMPNNGALTITPTSVNQTIPTGYHNGSGVVQGSVSLKNINNPQATWTLPTAITSGSIVPQSQVILTSKYVVFSYSASLYAFDKVTGANVWTYAMNFASNEISPSEGIRMFVDSSDNIYYMTANSSWAYLRNLYSVNGNTGVKQWEATLGSSSYGAGVAMYPIIVNGNVLVPADGTTTTYFYPVNISTGAVGSIVTTVPWSGDFIQAWANVPGTNDIIVYASGYENSAIQSLYRVTWISGTTSTTTVWSVTSGLPTTLTRIGVFAYFDSNYAYYLAGTSNNGAGSSPTIERIIISTGAPFDSRKIPYIGSGGAVYLSNLPYYKLNGTLSVITFVIKVILNPAWPTAQQVTSTSGITKYDIVNNVALWETLPAIGSGYGYTVDSSDNIYVVASATDQKLYKL